MLLFIALCVMAWRSARGITTYYVATNGLDANPGTIGSPFRTIQKGVNSAVAGDLVKVSPSDPVQRRLAKIRLKPR
jgi:hypothetical protein